MAESTLAAAYKDLQGDVGFFLGFGRGTNFGDPAWDARATQSIERCVKGGLRKVYHCGYEWSFLRPVAGNLGLASGGNTVLLPDDFGSPEGMVTIATTTGGLYWPIPFFNEGQVREKFSSLPSSTGRPSMCSIQPLKGTTQNQGQRFQLYLWPSADQAYTLQLAYYVNPDYVSGTAPYVYGGAAHAETFLAAAKATAEIDLDDIQEGPQWTEFMRLLEVSKRIDGRSKPQTLGYNADRSDLREGTRRFGREENYGNLVTVKGVQY